jgi:hypothetical protein
MGYTYLLKEVYFMKLILAIINKEDSTIVSQALTKARYSVTKLATTGGFLMSGNITLIIGDGEHGEASKLLRERHIIEVWYILLAMAAQDSKFSK